MVKRQILIIMRSMFSLILDLPLPTFPCHAKRETHTVSSPSRLYLPSRKLGGGGVCVVTKKENVTHQCGWTFCQTTSYPHNNVIKCFLKSCITNEEHSGCIWVGLEDLRWCG